MTTTAPFPPLPELAPYVHFQSYTVVSHGSEEYFVMKVNPKKLKVMRARDGLLQMGDHRAFTFVRDMTSEDRAQMHGHEKVKSALNPQVSTETFALGNHVVLKKGVKPIAGIAAGTEFVVIGVNAKSVNIVPDGGYGNGMQYFRFVPNALEIVKANNNPA